MDFLRPALLWGLLGLAVPVLVHLLGQRRVRTVSVATLRFLEAARARAAARWRLRRLLLLLARALALGALAVLYAGPGCSTAGGPGGPALWVLVLDTSVSMGAARGGPTRLDEARSRLLAVVDRAGPEDRFAVLTTADRPWGGTVLGDPALVRRLLLDARLEHGPHRVDRALEAALAVAAGAPGGRVVLAGDVQRSGWPPGLVAGAGSVPLGVVDVGLPDPANGWVEAVEEEASAVRVRLGASGAEPPRRAVHLAPGAGRRLTAFVGGREAAFQAGTLPTDAPGLVSLEPGGDLTEDDELAFVGKTKTRPQVLLVNGDPRGFEIQDELFFLRRALAPGSSLGARIEAREVRLGDLGPAHLEAADAVVLANPGPLPPGLDEALARRLEAGAGLLVTAGDRVPAGEGARWLAAPRRDAVAVPPGDPLRRPFEALDPGSFAGPALPFREAGAGDLGGTRVTRYWVLEARAGDEVKVWMRLENGAPLLVERRVGRGRSLLLTTTIDRDGADLCLQPGFVPWLEQALLYAAGRLGPALGVTVRAGYPVELPFEGPVTLEGPGELRLGWRPGAPPFVPPVPGVYRAAAAGEEAGWLIARVDPGESDLTPLSPGELDARLGAGAYSRGVDEGPGSGVVLGRRDGSPAAAALLLGLVGAEALLSGRWRRRRPVDLLADGAASGGGRP